jgi:calcium-dependent protein kinase
LKDLNFDLEDQEIMDIISNADFDGTNTISYTEFLAATMDLQNFLDETKLLAAFRKFDTDNSGELT